MIDTRTQSAEYQVLFTRQVTVTAEILFHGKWKLHILCALRSGPVRLGQLARMIPRASKKVLTQSLRELEASGVILRKDLSELVLHIEYELRPDLKEDVSHLLDHLAEWGGGYLKDVNGSSTERGKGPGGGT